MSARVEVVDPGVLRIVLPGQASNAYLFLGKRLALVDCGAEDSQRDLLAALRQLEIKRERISLVVLTHEHAGHAGGAEAFPDALLVAHTLAAAKLRHGEEGLTKLTGARAPDVELSDGGAIRIGGFSFDVLHMPGHTSGSICLYERSRALIVTGDTVHARGSVPVVTHSGSSGEHLESLERLGSLRARLLLPGHGPPSDDPVADIAAAANTVQGRLNRWVGDQHAETLA
jgi:glyoxylase-like metal-dependent hydrolase (beta-lactamase superfamily II)